MAEHSPTPWTADDTGSLIVASNGNVICVLPGVPLLKTSEQDKANFKHIEKCVNVHDTLTADLAAARAEVEQLRVLLSNVVTSPEHKHYQTIQDGEYGSRVVWRECQCMYCLAATATLKGEMP